MAKTVGFKTFKQGWNKKWEIMPYGENGNNTTGTDYFGTINDLEKKQAIKVCELLNWSIKQGRKKCTSDIRKFLYIKNKL